VTNKVVTDCLSAQGYSSSLTDDDVISEQAHFFHFEDPNRLREVGFGVYASLRPVADVAHRQITDAPDEILSKCFEEASGVTATLHNAEQPLFSAWSAQIDEIEASKAMMPAWDNWSTCMKAAGYTFARDDDAFSYVDAGVSAQTMTADGELAVGRAYADCIQQDVVQLRTELRNAARKDFIAANQDGLARSSEIITDQVESLSAHYGVAFPS
jgi:hypothetical protein